MKATYICACVTGEFNPTDIPVSGQTREPLTDPQRPLWVADSTGRLKKSSGFIFHIFQRDENKPGTFIRNTENA